MVTRTTYIYKRPSIDLEKKISIRIKIHGERIDMFRFADDIALMAESKEDLQQMLTVMTE